MSLAREFGHEQTGQRCPLLQVVSSFPAVSAQSHRNASTTDLCNSLIANSFLNRIDNFKAVRRRDGSASVRGATTSFAARSSGEKRNLITRCNDRGRHGLSLLTTNTREGNTPLFVSVVDVDDTNIQTGSNKPSWAPNRGAGANHASAGEHVPIVTDHGC